MTPSLTEGLAIAACGLLLLGAAFQLGLSAGAPWAAAAYGGRAALSHGRLPSSYRAASLVTAVPDHDRLTPQAVVVSVPASR